MELTRKQLLKAGAVGAAGASLPLTILRPGRAPAAINTIGSDMPLIPKAQPVGPNRYRITAKPGTTNFHPQFGQTNIWGYDDGSGRGVRSPGYVIEAKKGTPVTVDFVNGLPNQHLFSSTVPDYMYEGQPVRMNTHLHGAHVAGASDGNPYATPGEFRPGQTQTNVYPNDQSATSLWYHDHGDQITRKNVYAGLVGLYLLRDNVDTGLENNGLGVPGGKYEIPLIIQDKLFDSSGQLFYSDSPTWIPEFFGDTPVVNGAALPKLQVEPRMYRFRVLNASNARFYNLNWPASVKVWQIGSDGGLFNKPVPLNNLIILPAERCDLIVDFSGAAGKAVPLQNGALPPEVSSPAPKMSQVMQFRVGTTVTAAGPRTVPTKLPGTMPALGAPVLTRNMTLEEVEDPATGEPAFGDINGRKFDDARGVQERCKVNTIEDWRLVNITADSHPIHLHLVQFQIMDRTPFAATRYAAALDAARAADPNAANPDPRPYLTGPAIAPDANERGWKDTVRSNPGQVTRIRMRWTLPAGVTAPQRYVSHCHILEHEDNSMMRPLEVIA